MLLDNFSWALCDLDTSSLFFHNLSQSHVVKTTFLWYTLVKKKQAPELHDHTTRLHLNPFSILHILENMKGNWSVLLFIELQLTQLNTPSSERL